MEPTPRRVPAASRGRRDADGAHCLWRRDVLAVVTREDAHPQCDRDGCCQHGLTHPGLAVKAQRPVLLREAESCRDLGCCGSVSGPRDVAGDGVLNLGDSQRTGVAACRESPAGLLPASIDPRVVQVVPWLEGSDVQLSSMSWHGAEGDGARRPGSRAEMGRRLWHVSVPQGRGGDFAMPSSRARGGLLRPDVRQVVQRRRGTAGRSRLTSSTKWTTTLVGRQLMCVTAMTRFGNTKRRCSARRAVTRRPGPTGNTDV